MIGDPLRQAQGRLSTGSGQALDYGTVAADAAMPAAATTDDDGPDTGDKEGLLLTAKKWFREDREHSSQWRRDAEEDFDFAAARQWSDEDKRILRDQTRPEITFDKVGSTVRTIVGIEVGNRREVRFYPRSEGDAKPDDVLTAAAQWAREGCDAEDEETDAFRDCIICGMGWVDTRMDYEVEPMGLIRQERLDPFEMYWDAAARKPNLADARRTWRVRTMPIEDARLLAPDAEDHDLDAIWARADNPKQPHDADPQVAYQQPDAVETLLEDREPETVTLVHLQYFERENYYQVAFNGQIQSVAEKDYPELKRRADKLSAANLIAPIRSVKQIRKVYKQALIGRKVLSMGPAACEGHFSWECITGERDQTEGVWYGIVRTMKDPQRWANKWLSQSLHILNSNAKGGLFAERGAFDNDVEAEQSIARTDRITWMKTGALAAGRVQPKQPPALPQNLADLMSYALSSIRDASGVNLELAGMQTGDQPAALAETRKQSGLTILAGLFDSLRRYRKRQGRIMLYFITNYISDGRLIRIVGPEGAQYVPLVHQPGLTDYDVIVDDDPTSTNQKEKVWATLMQMMPFLGDKLDASDMAILFEYSPLPQTVVEKWQQKIATDQAQQAPIQQAQVQSTLQIAQTKAALQQAQAEQAQANAQKLISDTGQPQANDAAMDAQLEYEKLIQQGQIDAAKLVHDAQLRIAAIQSKHELGQQKLAAEFESKRQQQQFELAKEAGWMRTDSAIKTHAAETSAAAKAHAATLGAAAKVRAAQIAAAGDIHAAAIDAAADMATAKRARPT